MNDRKFRQMSDYQFTEIFSAIQAIGEVHWLVPQGSFILTISLIFIHGDEFNIYQEEVCQLRAIYAAFHENRSVDV